MRLTPASLSFSPFLFFLFVFFPKLRLSPLPQPCSNPTLKVTQPSTQNPVSLPGGGEEEERGGAPGKGGGEEEEGEGRTEEGAEAAP